MAEFVKTKYDNKTSAELYRMFAQDTYFQLSDADKGELFQATLNDFCKQRGMGPCTVEFKDLGQYDGFCKGNHITLNSEIAFHQRQLLSFNGPDGPSQYEVLIEDANYRALESILHEAEHAYQNQAVEGIIQLPEAERKLYESNDFTVSLVGESDGQRGSQYLKGVGPNGYVLYRLNPTELKAFQNSQEAVKQIIQQNPIDSTGLAYLGSLQTNGYEVVLNEAQQQFAAISDDVAADVATVLQNAHFGEEIPVNPEFKKIVEEEMIASQQVLDQSKEEQLMNHDPEITAFDAAQTEITEPAIEVDAEADLTAFDAAQTDIDSSVAVTSDEGLEADTGGIDGGMDNDAGIDAGMDL